MLPLVISSENGIRALGYVYYWLGEMLCEKKETDMGIGGGRYLAGLCPVGKQRAAKKRNG
ncbi:MAG: hypothetical protein Kow0080_25680 [Candidatus Promineifilaceae bacterium]